MAAKIVANEPYEFSPAVCQRLKNYVYRLIDPRNGETFYVGMGQGNRVFRHVKEELGVDADELTEKLKRIKEIRKARFEVSHVIHRHGMDPQTAKHVEAALIQAYPGIINEINGHGSEGVARVGLMHAEQIIGRYGAPEAIIKPKDRVILICVNRSIEERPTAYDAVRYMWVVDPVRAKKAEVVLAVLHGLIIGVYIPEKWLPTTLNNVKDFPGITSKHKDRWGFIGHSASDEIERRYLRHRVPDRFRKQGMANPIKYSYR